MHARITTARVSPHSASEVERVWRTLLSAYSDADAFRGMLSLYDEAQNVAVTVTLWASDDAADKAAVELRPLALEAFDGLLLEPPVIEKYSVLISEAIDGR